MDGLVVSREEVLECGIEGVSGWECKTCDRAQIISSSQQVFGEVTTCSEIFMVSPKAALEHCKKYNVAGFSFGIRAFGRRSRPKEAKLPVGVARMVANVL